MTRTATRLILPALLGLSLLGCTDTPDLDAAIPASEQQGSYPPLVPVETLLAQAEAPRLDGTEDEALAARAAALRARAARLKSQ